MVFVCYQGGQSEILVVTAPTLLPVQMVRCTHTAQSIPYRCCHCAEPLALNTIYLPRPVCYTTASSLDDMPRNARSEPAMSSAPCASADGGQRAQSRTAPRHGTLPLVPKAELPRVLHGEYY